MSFQKSCVKIKAGGFKYIPKSINRQFSLHKIRSSDLLNPMYHTFSMVCMACAMNDHLSKFVFLRPPVFIGE
jgi:hypothetical protein